MKADGNEDDDESAPRCWAVMLHIIALFFSNAQMVRVPVTQYRFKICLCSQNGEHPRVRSSHGPPFTRIMRRVAEVSTWVRPLLTAISPPQHSHTFAMARTKIPPRRVIHKPRSTLRTASLSVQRAPQCDIFTSPTSVRAEVLRIVPSEKATPHTHIVLAPGNPGVIEYYRPLLHKLHTRLPHDIRNHVSLHALGLPGHDLRQLNGDTQFVIQDHVAYYVHYLREMTHLQHNFIFIGHSYGAFLSLRVLHSLGDKLARNANLVMLMPCIWQMAYCAGPFLRLLIQDNWALTSWGAWLATAFLPPMFREALLKRTQHSHSVLDVTRAVIDGRRRALYSNVTSLARDEMKRITNVQAHRLPQRSLMLYVENDRWCPERAKRHIRRHFEERLEIQHLQKVSHSFVLSDFETDRLVRAIAPWIAERIRHTINDTKLNGNASS